MSHEIAPHPSGLGVYSPLKKNQNWQATNNNNILVHEMLLECLIL
jgi:hypothetical protein